MNPIIWIIIALLVACSGGGTNNNLTPDADASTDATLACSCPNLQPGDIFTVCGQPQILRFALNPQGEAMYFTSDAAFESWRPSNEVVPSISTDCFDQTPVPSDFPVSVNFRPGSFVVKLERFWNPEQLLHVILPGNTIAQISPQVAAALYSVPAYPNGATDEAVEIIAPHWENLIHLAPEITEVRVHPGMLFVITDGTDIYYVDVDGLIRGVTPAGFDTNHFQKKFVRRVPLSAISGMSFGELITGRVPRIEDPTQGGN
jgi:hypothetical protein